MMNGRDAARVPSPAPWNLACSGRGAVRWLPLQFEPVDGQAWLTEAEKGAPAPADWFGRMDVAIRIAAPDAPGR